MKQAKKAAKKATKKTAARKSYSGRGTHQVTGRMETPPPPPEPMAATQNGAEDMRARGEQVLNTLKMQGSFLPAAAEADAARMEYRSIERIGQQMRDKLSHLNQQIDMLENQRRLVLEDMAVQEADLRTANIQLSNKLNALHRAANEAEPYMTKKVLGGYDEGAKCEAACSTGVYPSNRLG